MRTLRFHYETHYIFNATVKCVLWPNFFGQIFVCFCRACRLGSESVSFPSSLGLDTTLSVCLTLCVLTMHLGVREWRPLSVSDHSGSQYAAGFSPSQVLDLNYKFVPYISPLWEYMSLNILYILFELDWIKIRLWDLCPWKQPSSLKRK